MKGNSNFLAAAIALLIFTTNGLCTRSAQASSDVANPIFGYTHLLPSPYTVPMGTLVLGTNVELGLTDFFQVGSNILLDFYKIFNANAEISVLDFEGFALGLTLGLERYNLHDIDSSNPGIGITSWLPGVTTGFSPDPTFAVFFGGNLNYTSTLIPNSGLATSGYITGARLNSDVSWAYNPKKKGLGNVLSGGVSYDVNYSLFGIGISHHWRGLHLGVHYYPDASKNKWQPILSGGAVVDL